MHASTPTHPRVFEIGLGRTGTTSLTTVAALLGHRTLHWGRHHFGRQAGAHRWPNHHTEFLVALLAGRRTRVVDDASQQGPAEPVEDRPRGRTRHGVGAQCG